MPETLDGADLLAMIDADGEDWAMGLARQDSGGIVLVCFAHRFPYAPPETLPIGGDADEALARLETLADGLRGEGE